LIYDIFVIFPYKFKIHSNSDDLFKANLITILNISIIELRCNSIIFYCLLWIGFNIIHIFQALREILYAIDVVMQCHPPNIGNICIGSASSFLSGSR
jgi:hypothetical protein